MPCFCFIFWEKWWLDINSDALLMTSRVQLYTLRVVRWWWRHRAASVVHLRSPSHDGIPDDGVWRDTVATRDSHHGWSDLSSRGKTHSRAANTRCSVDLAMGPATRSNNSPVLQIKSFCAPMFFETSGQNSSPRFSEIYSTSLKIKITESQPIKTDVWYRSVKLLLQIPWERILKKLGFLGTKNCTQLQFNIFYY